MAVTEDRGVVRQKVDAYVRRLAESGIPVWRAYLYGSYANGTPRVDSDIDLAIFLDKDDIDGFREDVELMRLRWDIDLRIEPHAFARTDFDETSPFIREIVESGQRIV